VKTTRRHILITAVLVGALAMSGLATQAFAQDANFDKLANLPFPEDYPTKDTTQTLRDELLFQRATQVYLWALPILNTMGMKEGSEKVFGAGYNVLPTWKQRLDAKTIVTTPNSDVINAMSYLDVGKDGPLVVEVPGLIQGMFDDFYQRPLPGVAPGGTPWSGDVVFSGLTKARAASFFSCRLVILGRFPAIPSFIVPPPTISFCSGAPSIRKLRI